MSDPSPSSGSPFSLKPDGRVITNWQTLIAVIAGTALIVGGLLSIKSDIAGAITKARDAADVANTALDVARDIRDELTRLRWQIGADARPSALPGTKPTTRNIP